MIAYRTEINADISKPRYSKDCNLGTLCASVKQFSRACTMLFALSADRSNSQSDFCRIGPLFLDPGHIRICGV